MLRVLRVLLLFFFRQVMRIFFRKVEVQGAPPTSTSGRLFGANHVNGVIDPALMMTTTWCRIAPLAKAPLWKVPGLNLLLKAAEAVPVVRRQDEPGKAEGSNDELFGKVAGHLSSGGNVLIFPEGISHSEPHVVRLKTGAGRMLKGAYDLGTRGMTFQAVGLEFDERETFRSRALVIYGPVRSVDEVVERGGDAALAITDQLREDLTELIVEGSTWDEKQLIARVAELLAHESGDRSLAGWNSVGRKVEAARKALSGERAGLYDEVNAAVGRYYEGLAAARLTDELLLDGQGDEGPRALRLLGLLLLLPLAVVGAALYFVPYQIPKLAPRLAKGERDVISTYKLGIGLLVFPGWAALLALVSLAALPWPLGLGAAAAAVAAPFAVLPWLDEIDRLQGEEGEADGPALSEDELRRLRGEALVAIARVREQIGA